MDNTAGKTEGSPPPAGLARLHAEGHPCARIGERVGHGDLVTAARTDTHVIADEAELDYGALARA